MAVTATVENGQVVYRDAAGAVLTPAQVAALAPAGSVQERNRRDLIAKAETALTANVTYLAISAPTNAQNTAQVKSLTRQVNALIRLTVKALDTAAGT